MGAVGSYCDVLIQWMTPFIINIDCMPTCILISVGLRLTYNKTTYIHTDVMRIKSVNRCVGV